jgi:hypothetical protein
MVCWEAASEAAASLAELSASTEMQHLFHIMDAAGYRNTYYNWQAAG